VLRKNSAGPAPGVGAAPAPGEAAAAAAGGGAGTKRKTAASAAAATRVGVGAGVGAGIDDTDDDQVEAGSKRMFPRHIILHMLGPRLLSETASHDAHSHYLPGRSEQGPVK